MAVLSPIKFLSILTTIACWTVTTSMWAYQTGIGSIPGQVSDAHSITTFHRSEIGNTYPVMALFRADFGPVYAVSPDDFSVFEFDGSTWKASKFEQAPLCASCDRQNRVWVGAENGAYVGQENQAGILEFERCVIPFRTDDNRALRESTPGENGATLFNSNLVVQISPDDCQVKRFPKEELVVHADADVILTIDRDQNQLSIHRRAGTSFIDNFTGALAVPLGKEGYLELDQDNTIWFREGCHRRIFSKQLQDRIGKREIFYFQQLRNNNVGIGTTDGFFECSAGGDLLRAVDTNDGLNDGFVYRAISDFEGNIWMIDGSGLAVVRKDQGRVQQRFAARTTETLDLEQLGSHVYFATTRGCQVLDPVAREFRPIAELEGLYVSDLCRYGDSIMAAAGTGLFEITERSATRVIDGRVTGVCRFGDSRILAAVSEFDRIIAATDENGWHELQSVRCPFEIFKLHSVGETSVAVFGFAGEVKVLEFDRQQETLVFQDVSTAERCFGSASIGGEKLFCLPAGLHRIAASGQGYVFESATDLPYSAAMNRLFAEHHDYYTFFVFNETQFAVCGNESIDIYSLDHSGQLTCLGGWQLSHELAIVPGINYGSGQLLGVHDNFLIHFDLNQIPRKPVLLKPLVDVFASGVGETGFHSSIGIDSRGGLRFSFTEPFGNYQPNSVEFQFRLDGLDDDWSDWTSMPQKEYMNLRGGSYQFQVRSRIATDIVSEIATVSFSVVTPWYLSSWFFVVSTIGLIAIGYTFSQIRSRVLTKYNLRIEEMVRERTPELEQQKIRVKEQSELIVRQSREHESLKMESLSAMMGAIAHDFNNLLCVIAAHGEVLSVSNNELVRFSADNIKTAAGSASELCDQLHIVSGAFPIDTQHLNLRDLVQESVQLVNGSLPGNVEVVFKSKTAVDYDARILGDPSELKRVVMNLIVNAGEAANGNICVETGTSELSGNEIAAGRFIGDPPTPGKFEWLQVTDDGDGLPDEVTRKIFDPFFTTKRLGRGLGLAIVMRIVGRHNGIIFVESHSDSGRQTGTRFRVCLPSLYADPTAFEPTTESSRPDFASLNILIVDDDPAVLESLQTLLGVVGHKTHIESSASIVIERIQRLPSLDLALIDLTMPEIMGDQLARQITDLFPDLPIILMSGYSETNLDPALLQMPHIAFVGKPLNLEILNQKMQSLCSSGVRSEFQKQPAADDSTKVDDLD